MSYSVLKVKCESLIAHLQDHKKDFRYIIVFEKKSFAVILLIIQCFKGNETDIQN